MYIYIYVNICVYRQSKVWIHPVKTFIHSTLTLQLLTEGIKTTHEHTDLDLFNVFFFAA